MAYQTNVSQNPPLGVSGMISDTSLRDAISTFAEGPPPGILPGRLVVRGTAYDQARLPEALAADADAIILTGASATVAAVFSGTLLDGVVGSDRVALPTKLDLVLNADAAWLATNAILIGIDSTGAQVSELIAIPAGGNVTVPSVGAYSQVVSLGIPIQGAATGTFTLGIQGPASAVLTKAQIRGVVHNNPTREGTADLHGISNGLVGEPFLAGQGMAVLTWARPFVTTEDAVLSGSPAFARIVNSAAAGLPSNAGQFRSDADGGNAVAVPGARYGITEGTIAQLLFDFRD